MRDDELTNILRDSEADLPPKSLLAGELAARVRAAQRTQQRRRRLAVAASLPVAAALAFVAWSVQTNPTRQPDVPTPSQVAEITADEIDRLIAEAEAHERNARAMIAAQPPRDAALADDPLADIREELDVVAYRMILEADDLRAQMQPTAAAIELYQKVQRLFPTSYSAEVARERLHTLGVEQGDS
jgi:hypothetical protein